jgi:hypothetical protein
MMLRKSPGSVDQVKPTPSNNQQARPVGEACGLSGEVETTSSRPSIVIFPTHDFGPDPNHLKSYFRNELHFDATTASPLQRSAS